MLLGKRPRPPMRRTTSMTEFSFDLGSEENPEPTDQEWRSPGPPPQTMEGALVMNNSNTATTTTHVRRQHQKQQQRRQHQYQYHLPHQGPSDGLDTRFVSSMVSPRNPRMNSGDLVVETAHFLRACGLCNRRLVPGKDIYMYRGDIAFCSLECRQQQMTLDERKEKCSFTSMKKDPPQVSVGSPEPSGSGETVAAA